MLLQHCSQEVEETQVPSTDKMNGSRQDFPGGPVFKNPPSNAGDEGSISGQGSKIPYAHGATEPTHHS